MRYVFCDNCGAIIKQYEVRGWCSVCGKRTCIFCARTCDQCLRAVCQNCIHSAELWRDNNHYFRNLCKRCQR